MRPRRRCSKLIAIGVALTLLLFIRVCWPPNIRLPVASPVPTGATRSCPPKAYAKGKWIYSPRTNNTSITHQDDMLRFAGFEGCASSREYYWHLGADDERRWERLAEANLWRWQPDEDECQLGEMRPEELLRELVEQGGWLLIGDSITEGHFFSLSCMLYPHVRATPDYTNKPHFDRAWPQNLYLNAESPLVSSFTFPQGFSVADTPLVTFRRVDLLFEKQQLVELHRSLRAEPANFTLLSSEPVWSLDPAEYMNIFTAGYYKTMVVSTGGHWTTTLFSGYRDEAKVHAGYGIDGVVQFFGQAMDEWANYVQRVLTKDQKHKPGGRRKREVVVRAYLPGHEDCHKESKPWNEIKPFVWNWWNWGSIWEFNFKFEKMLSGAKFQNIHYLPIDVPGRLRPDTHVSSDCLHIVAGPGVLEGWSHYISHFVTHE
ncbi:hypothetical protein C8J57DRAFT_1120801, partial [Mycena rebaudengoi]